MIRACDHCTSSSSLRSCCACSGDPGSPWQLHPPTARLLPLRLRGCRCYRSDSASQVSVRPNRIAAHPASTPLPPSLPHSLSLPSSALHSPGGTCSTSLSERPALIVWLLLTGRGTVLDTEVLMPLPVSMMLLINSFAPCQRLQNNNNKKHLASQKFGHTFRFFSSFNDY